MTGLSSPVHPIWPPGPHWKSPDVNVESEYKKPKRHEKREHNLTLIFKKRAFFCSSPAGLPGSPILSDISLIRLSPAVVATGESPFSPPHPYVSPHLEHYLRSVHGSPTLSTISAARGLSPADCESTTATRPESHHCEKKEE